jgi:Secretion system C-terminal sorting domain
MNKKIILTATILCAISLSDVTAQKTMWRRAKGGTVCYGKAEDHNFVLPPPEQYDAIVKNGRTKSSSNFNVNYIGFTDEARAAFQKAVDIWEAIIVSPITINVTAQWVTLGDGVLGSATAGTFHANFNGAQQLNVFYPAALAEKMANKELNDSTDPDIFASFNSANTSWSFSLDQNEAIPGKYSLVTVVLHELGHGLGFLDSYSVTGTNGIVGLQGTGVPVPYDLQLENATNTNLFIGFTSPSSALRSQLISNNLFYRSPNVLVQNGGATAKIYAPTTFDPGSSIAHWNESTFNGTANALMTPQVATNERIFDPGAITKALLADMGWEFVYIDHAQLTDLEDTTGPYEIVATFSGDKLPIASPKTIYNSGAGEIELDMVPTGITNQYKATIPSTGSASTYAYYIKVNDATSRSFTEPGKITRVTTGTQQQLFVFATGPDTKAPKIVHQPKDFLIDAEQQLEITATISDNAKVQTAKLEYFLNNVAQPTLDLVLQSPEEDSIYSTLINIASLTDGQKLKYRIVVTDNAANTNQATSPARDFYEINTVGLLPLQDSYLNDYSVATDDFFAAGFTAQTPSGFTNAAIHSEHPYITGDGFPNNERNLTYQLKVPVEIKATESLLKFDEIVLVEPGAANSVFGDSDFFDYVIVEGSKDGGLTWTALGPGYDARDRSAWLTRYNSNIDTNPANNGNSLAIGDPSLYFTRTYNILDKFTAGDQVVFRFRLFIDQLSTGWGWAIDNVKIQIDDTPPTIAHNHIDWLKAGSDFPTVSVVVSDGSNLLEDVVLTLKKNGNELSTLTASGVTSGQTIAFNTELTSLVEGDVYEYKISTSDGAGNASSLPATGFLKVPITSFANPVTTYATQFETASTDFAGNFFSIQKPTGFSSNSIQTDHPYSVSFGLEASSSFTYTLLRPIIVNATNPYVKFNEIAIVHQSDYVVVEASKDDGVSWIALTEEYDAAKQSAWILASNSGTAGNSSLYRERLFSLLKLGQIEDEDEVLLRFRLFTNQTLTSWGWAIDDLFIQDQVTSVEALFGSLVTVYPNPFDDEVTIDISSLSENDHTISFSTTQGKPFFSKTAKPIQGKIRETIPLGSLSTGLYLLRISDGSNTVVRKIVRN